MEKRLFSFLLVLCSGAYVLTAQTTVNGTVTDTAGEPMPGVSVVLKGSGKGVTTDVDGAYTIEASHDDTIVFSFLGMLSQEQAVGNRALINVVLKADSTLLDEVVVVGYGVKKRENLTGAIEQIKGDEKLVTGTVTSIAQNLSGKVAGLQIRQENGEPGNYSSTINVRGFGEPLYVIDGIPQTGGSSFFQRLNPNDIESISVIKDALGAIYGRRGANGVVLVTTKQGTSEKPVFNLDISVGMEMPTDMPAMANRSQWAQLYNEAQGFAGHIAYTPEELQHEMTAPTTDWYNLTMKKMAVQQQYFLSAQGGGKAVKYYVGVGYLNEDGILKSGDLNYEKFTLRSNITATLAKDLKLELGVSGTYDEKNSPALGYYSAFYAARTALPGAEAYANGNTDYLAKQSYMNPIAIADSDISGYSKNNDKTLNANLNLTYDFPFLKGLSARIGANYTYHNVMNKTLTKSYNVYTYSPGADVQYVPTPINSPSKISNSYVNVDMLTLQGQLSYNRTFAGKHAVDATFIYEQYGYHSRVASLAREYSFYTGDQIDLASMNNMTNSGMENDITNMSFIGRASYGYDNRYLFDVSFRYDGSCLYAPEKRWGFFPVASAAWRISEEKFMKNQKVVSNLKIRASYGLVGEDNGLPFQYVQGFSLTGGSSYEFENGTLTEGAASPSLVNRDLTWFKSYIADVGLDVGLFNKLSMSVDFYQRDRKGLLSTRLLSLPNTFGATLPQENLNSDRTLGVDLSVSFNDKAGDFHYSITGNFNYARTKNIYVEQGAYTSSMDRWRSSISDRWSDVYWGNVYDGQFQNEAEILDAPIQSSILGNGKVLPGDYRYKDMNGDGVIDGNDQMPLFYGGYPKIFYGLTFAFDWKGLDFSMLLQGSALNTVRFKEVYAEVLAFNLNTPAYFFDRWHKEDPFDANSAWVKGKWPAARFISDAGSMYLESSVWRKDASYLRLKNICLGYTMPKKWFSKTSISKLRLYFNANNVLTICDPFVRPFDPEKSEGTNSLGFNYPLMMSFNFGLNIVF